MGQWHQTQCHPPEPLPALPLLLPVVYSVICAVGLVGNAAVICVILSAQDETVTTCSS